MDKTTILDSTHSVDYPSSITHKGEKNAILFRFNFEGVALDNALHTASKDLTTDIQNTTRGMSAQATGYKEASELSKGEKRKSLIAEQEENGFVLIMVKDKGKRFTKTLTLTQQVSISSEDELNNAMAAITAKLKAIKADK